MRAKQQRLRRYLSSFDLLSLPPDHDPNHAKRGSELKSASRLNTRDRQQYLRAYSDPQDTDYDLIVKFGRTRLNSIVRWLVEAADVRLKPALREVALLTSIIPSGRDPRREQVYFGQTLATLSALSELGPEDAAWVAHYARAVLLLPESHSRRRGFSLDTSAWEFFKEFSAAIWRFQRGLFSAEAAESSLLVRELKTGTRPKDERGRLIDAELYMSVDFNQAWRGNLRGKSGCEYVLSLLEVIRSEEGGFVQRFLQSWDLLNALDEARVELKRTGQVNVVEAAISAAVTGPWLAFARPYATASALESFEDLSLWLGKERLGRGPNAELTRLHSTPLPVLWYARWEAERTTPIDIYGYICPPESTLLRPLPEATEPWIQVGMSPETAELLELLRARDGNSHLNQLAQRVGSNPARVARTITAARASHPEILRTLELDRIAGWVCLDIGAASRAMERVRTQTTESNADD